jgi:UDP-glucose 4-epimerase
MPEGCVLVTGGAGFIGSHSVIEMVNAGYMPIVVDNMVNANAGEFLGRNKNYIILRPSTRV